ncbi:hypothetical protein M2281_003866 [Mesorhizobium soli]|nr:hypothetical protein [Mesorhizobium soli]
MASWFLQSRVLSGAAVLACVLCVAGLALLRAAGNPLAVGVSEHSVVESRPVSLRAAYQTRPVQFPLKVSANNRYLIDSADNPILLAGDAAWSLIAQLTREDVDLYLNDRQARGFNAILVNLIENKFAENAPANAYGDQPFLRKGDFGTPNEAYFKHAEWVIQRAAEHGMLVLLAPCYSGADDGAEGWYREMQANGVEKLREYGRFLGTRFGRYQNIVWVDNGDLNPPERDLVQAIAQGLHEADPNALQTSHNGTGTAGADLWPKAAWLTLNNVYTWGPVFTEARKQYLRAPTMPFILIESQYENGPDITTRRLRGQAYQALLTGASGQVFGNSPIWYFDGVDFFHAPPGWRKALDGEGSRSMARLTDLFRRLRWQDLVPDVNNRFLVRGQSDDQLRNVAARNADGSMAVIYLSDDRQITLKMGPLAGRRVRAVWWDPVGGESFQAQLSPFIAGDTERFRPNRSNAGGDHDWVLLLEEEDNHDR